MRLFRPVYLGSGHKGNIKGTEKVGRKVKVKSKPHFEQERCFGLAPRFIRVPKGSISNTGLELNSSLDPGFEASPLRPRGDPLNAREAIFSF